MIIGIGNDLCNIERVEKTLARFGERFEKRVFTDVEIALARWIAISRRTGEEIKIDFESREAPTAGFKEQLARIKKANA